MSPDDPRLNLIIADRIDHMIEAIDRILEFTAGMDAEGFVSNIAIRFACERAFQIIGEAAGSIPESFRDEHPSVPWSDMRRYRNFLVHVYDKVDPAKVWAIIEHDVPTLRDRLAALRDHRA